MINQAIAEFCQKAKEMGYRPSQYNEVDEYALGGPKTYQVHVISIHDEDQYNFGMRCWHEMVRLATEVAEKYNLEETVSNHERKQDPGRFYPFSQDREISIAFYFRKSNTEA